MARFRASPSDGVVWITGASSGIGRAVALELARRDFVVAATGRQRSMLDTLTEEGAKLPGRIVAFEGDVTDGPGMAALVERIARDLGPLSLAFLNAGTFFTAARAGFDAEAFERTFEVNVLGIGYCLEPVIAGMSTRRCGQIVLNASLAGYGGLPGSAAYGPSKAAVIHLAEALTFDLHDRNITVQVVCPGYVKTPLTDRNNFDMPLLMDVDEAARRICDGFAQGGFEIAFPRRLSWLLKVINMLPYPAYFALLRRSIGTRNRSSGV